MRVRGYEAVDHQQIGGGAFTDQFEVCLFLQIFNGWIYKCIGEEHGTGAE
jgi:hypothetical protein